MRWPSADPLVAADVVVVVIVVVVAVAVAAAVVVRQLPGNAFGPHDVAPDELIHKLK